ncbi:MAG: Uridine nucleosidase 1 [Chrysothrix sp. TS-e1954]|nr:MAG: Uridine nucleosidase 1 [Chrysothrix sp. TS-e1954]
MSDQPMPIWLDCDTGHDDAFALLLAGCNEQVKLLGVSTVHGNASVEHTTYNTRAFLKAIGREDVVVIKGAAKPLKREPCYASDIHGKSGLDGVTLLPKPAVPSSKPDYLDLRAAASIIFAQAPGTVWLVATGPLTNIAQLLHLCPELVDHLGGISIMGGAIGSHYTDAPLGTVKGVGERFGNWTPYSEFNIYADPEAAADVLQNTQLSHKMTLIPLDLTHQCRGNVKVQDYLFGALRGNLSSIRRLMREVLIFFSGTYRTQFGIMDGPPLHDPIAVYAAICPEAFDDNGGERWTLEVIATGASFDMCVDPLNRIGQTLIRPMDQAGVRVPRRFDMEKFWSAIDTAITKAESAMSEI